MNTINQHHINEIKAKYLNKIQKLTSLSFSNFDSLEDRYYEIISIIKESEKEIETYKSKKRK